MRFAKNWDELLVNNINQTQDPKKTIITVYPKPYKVGATIVKETGPCCMCFKEFSPKDGLPRWKSSPVKKYDKLKKPFKSLFWAAGMSFSAG